MNRTSTDWFVTSLLVWVLFVSIATGLVQLWCWAVPVREGQVWVDCRDTELDGSINCDTIRVVEVRINRVLTLRKPWYYNTEVPLEHNKFMFWVCYRRVK